MRSSRGKGTAEEDDGDALSLVLVCLDAPPVIIQHLPGLCCTGYSSRAGGGGGGEDSVNSVKAGPSTPVPTTNTPAVTLCALPAKAGCSVRLGNIFFSLSLPLSLSLSLSLSLWLPSTNTILPGRHLRRRGDAVLRGAGAVPCADKASHPSAVPLPLPAHHTHSV